MAVRENELNKNPRGRMSFANTGSEIASGAVVELGADATGLIGIAKTAIAATTGVGDVLVEGSFTLASETDTAWVEGDKLYWDGSLLTKTSTDNHLAGIAGAAKAQAAATGKVVLMGT